MPHPPRAATRRGSSAPTNNKTPCRSKTSPSKSREPPTRKPMAKTPDSQDEQKLVTRVGKEGDLLAVAASQSSGSGGASKPKKTSEVSGGSGSGQKSPALAPPKVAPAAANRPTVLYRQGIAPSFRMRGGRRGGGGAPLLSHRPKANYARMAQSRECARLIPALSSEADLEKEEWYHGILARDDQHRLLGNHGDFLVRRTEHDGKTNYVLSVMWQTKVRHLSVAQSAGRRWYIDKTEFDSIQDLVTYHLSRGEAIGDNADVILMNPIPRQDWELRHEQITLDVKLGNGAFGEVFAGTLKRPGQPLIKVAVKKANNDKVLTKEELESLQAEGRLMQKYCHENVIRFYGIACDRPPLMLVMELVTGGSLDAHLRKVKTQLDPFLKLRYVLDAARGMEYLHSRECIHRDIATRNCLVSGDNQVKIADFGLSKEGVQFKMTGGSNMLPVKWLSLETLLDGVYTFKSDVWSYGILIWEVYACGDCPYPGLTSSEVAKNVKTGYRMSPPPGMPDAVAKLMLSCWTVDPTARMNFTEMRRELTDLASEGY